MLHRNGQTTVYRHLHFANYGKFQDRMNEEAAAIAALVRSRCLETTNTISKVSAPDCDV
jgi:hypothetical protein